MQPHETASRQETAAPVRRSSHGFTLVEVVVAAVILAILGAITVPQIMDALDKKRVQDSYDILTEIQYAIMNTANTGFSTVVRSVANNSAMGLHPGRVSHLSEPILSNNMTNFPNSCGAQNALMTATVGAYSGANGNSGVSAQTTWTLGGPFLRRVVSTTDGLALPIGQLQNTILRTLNSTTAPPWGGAVGNTIAQYIRLRVNNVDSQDQVLLDLLVDGVAGTNVGRIWYTAGGTTIEFAMVVPNRC